MFRFDEVTLDFPRDYFRYDVPNRGYRWWYLDILSDDGSCSVVVIGFIGSVFSPYYAKSRLSGGGDPYNHCAMNAIIYSPRRKYWAMTERTWQQSAAIENGVRIGPSQMQWLGDRLQVDIREWTNPFPAPMRGRVEIAPDVLTKAGYQMHDNGRHIWWPAAPIGRATVNFSQPKLAFSGSAYFDTNFGEEPLEAGFDYWDWSRAEHPGNRPHDITYHLRQSDGRERTLALQRQNTGALAQVAPPGVQAIPRSFWRVGREICTDGEITNVKTLEDTPFYARSRVSTKDSDGEHVVMHEALSLQRFSSRWVQTLLPFRMPRRA